MFRSLFVPAIVAMTAVNGGRLNADPTVLSELDRAKISGVTKSAIGVTRRGTPILSLIGSQDFDHRGSRTRVLLVGGLDGSSGSVRATLGALDWFHTDQAAEKWRAQFTISAVPCVNPDGILERTAPANASGGHPARGYPPQGEAYNDPQAPESIYLWRWIGMHAPDLVVDVRHGTELRWFAPPSLASHFSPRRTDVAADSLAVQLGRVAACETGTVPALQVETPDRFLPQLLDTLRGCSFTGPSAARRELQRRLDRMPIEVAEQLSQHYGHDLKQVVYIPALALIARVRLGELTKQPNHLVDVERIAEPYLRGDQLSSPKSGSGLSGHLVFCELAEFAAESHRSRYLELARLAADLGFDDQGRPRPSMPFHLEMSDSVFMGGPILARVGRLTGESRYFDACVRHVQFMQQIGVRGDGIYRHSPLDETAWGRGNGFPALGLAMCLSDFPADHPQRKLLRATHRDHLRALVKHQDPTGMWHQVVDRPESYRELTSTCMITFAMIRGIRHGWLERQEFQPAITKAWAAIRTRVPPNGRLVDVCTGTGKQKSLREYYDRRAILGPDARGGAMALMVSTEMARFNVE